MDLYNKMNQEELSILIEEISNKYTSDPMKSAYYLGKAHFYVKNLDKSKNYFIQCTEASQLSEEDSLFLAKAFIKLSNISLKEESAEDSLKFSLKALQVLSNECTPDLRYMKIFQKGIELSKRCSKDIKKSNLRRRPYVSTAKKYYGY